MHKLIQPPEIALVEQGFHITPNANGAISKSNDMLFPPASKMRLYLQQKKPCNMSDSPSAYDYAMGESVWETLKHNALWKKGFDDTKNLVIVDIGGNQGVDLIRFAVSTSRL
ncbi:Hypothetical protein PENO1_023250 [Penicillium occitanis (nom. inval.)]|nr:Hypothetical protein PENO1_023250 [Penicillium occitanis (nom. inval.)]PCH06757.1 hypothetical protein PENOC_022640 [Penicillium occitanis (nom. inval.)]